jgi:hypothetical protein
MRIREPLAGARPSRKSPAICQRFAAGRSRSGLRGRKWARWAGIFIAALAAIGQIGIVTAFPIWSFIVILLAVLVIYNLIVHPYEPAPRRSGERQP